MSPPTSKARATAMAAREGRAITMEAAPRPRAAVNGEATPRPPDDAAL